jgi:hypothetical protein
MEDHNEVEYPSRFFDAGKLEPRRHVIPVACSGYLRAWRKKRDECSTPGPDDSTALGPNSFHEKDDVLQFNPAHPPLDSRRKSLALLRGRSNSIVDRKPSASLGPNLGIWALEGVVWLVSLLFAAHTGAGMERKASPRFPDSNDSEVRESVLVHGDRTPNFEPKAFTGDDNPVSLEGDAARRKLQAAYGRLPLSFEPNRGQAEDSSQFLSRSGNHSLLLKSNEALLELPTGSSPSSVSRTRVSGSESQFSILRMRLLGGSPGSEATAQGELSTKSHYFTSGDPAKWRTGVPNYSRVRYQNVYPGIDVVYYGSQQQLEYDFVVSPGGNPSDIRLSFEDGKDILKSPLVEIDSAGDLVLHTRAGVIVQRRAIAYQEIEGGRIEVPSKYVLKGGSEVGMDVGSYDQGKPLVIDPILSYSATGVGGSSIAVDSQGNAYVIGPASPAFETTPAAFQNAPGGGRCFNGPDTVPCPDIMVAKLNSSGTELVYATFLGGSGSEYGYGIAVDSAGSVYVTGTTTSADFPTTSNAFQKTHSGESCSAGRCNNAFVTKLNASGSSLVYSTYLHSESGGIGANGIAVDLLGCAYLTGDKNNDSFVTKLERDGSAVIYSLTGLGGSAIAVDADRNAYVTGRHQGDSFVSKLNAEAAIVYSFRLGGSVPTYSASPEEVEALTGIAADAAGNTYITGYTAHTDFPTTSDAPFRKAPGAGICGNSICRDAFVSKLNATGTALVYSTYLGGSSIDFANGIAVDAFGNTYVTGVTRSADFPIVEANVPSAAGSVFISKFNAAGTALVYSIVLGTGSSLEGGNGIATDSFSNVYVTGNAGGNFPVTPEAFHSALGNNDVFVTKLFEDLTLFVPVILSSAGQDKTFFTSELTLTNRSPKDVTLELNYTAAFGGGSGKVTDTLGANRQRVLPDAISYLKSLGMPIPSSGNRVGTLSIRFSGLSSPNDCAATVRTSTVVKQGRAGLAYQGISGPFAEATYLCGLRHNGAYRSSLAIQNAGLPTDGDITLRLTVFSGDARNPGPQTVYDETLSPGGFKQISSILQASPLSLGNGFVRVDRIRGSAPYYAYAVINDQSSADGSFVAPVPISSLLGRSRLTLPVIVETRTFSSEVVATNWSDSNKTVHLIFVADGIQAKDSRVDIRVILRAQEQLILPNMVEWLRQHGALGLGARDRDYVGSLFLQAEQGDVSNIFLGARTSTPAIGGGRYGVSYSAVPDGSASSTSAWLYGLRQDFENRTNLGIVNTAERDESPAEFRIEVYDGDTGLKVNTLSGIVIKARRLLQIGSLLAKYAPGVQQGYVKLTRTQGSNPFVAYSVINDGGQPGERSGDGAYLASSP